MDMQWFHTISICIKALATLSQALVVVIVLTYATAKSYTFLPSHCLFSHSFSSDVATVHLVGNRTGWTGSVTSRESQLSRSTSVQMRVMLHYPRKLKKVLLLLLLSHFEFYFKLKWRWNFNLPNFFLPKWLLCSGIRLCSCSIFGNFFSFEFVICPAVPTCRNAELHDLLSRRCKSIWLLGDFMIFFLWNIKKIIIMWIIIRRRIDCITVGSCIRNSSSRVQ